nr:DUF4236 domain-containing protein [Burkholderia multivorans]
MTFRKSIKAGPFRFNLSGSGVGVSVGVPGFRIGTGPRGNYISMSGGGFTYRTSLGSRRPHGISFPEASPASREDAEPRQGQRFIPSGSTTVAPLEVIQSADVRQLSDADSGDLVEEINAKRRKFAVWYWPLVLLGALWLNGLQADGSSNSVFVSVLAVLSIAAVVGCYWLYLWDEARRSIVLFYDFDDVAAQTYEHFLTAFEALRGCRSAWRILASGQVLDGRYNAGAARTLKRKSATLGMGGIRHVKCNIDVPCLEAGRNLFYFYPDRFFIVSGRHVAVCTYDSLDIRTQPTLFIEEEQVPSDSHVVDHTWRFVNKNGTPDRRFKNNQQIPIAQYEELRLFSAQGIQECFQFSRVGAAESFASALNRLARYGATAGRHAPRRRPR